MITADILHYNAQQTDADREICETLMQLISTELKGATCKLFHANPAWLLDDNPIVGYDVRKKGVMLMFWSGRAFSNSGLTAVGSEKFKAAGIIYTNAKEIDGDLIKAWLEESKHTQYDYKNIVKKKGRLDKLEMA